MAQAIVIVANLPARTIIESIATFIDSPIIVELVDFYGKVLFLCDDDGFPHVFVV